MSVTKKMARLKLLIYPKFQLTLIAANGIAVALALGFIGLQVKRSIETFRKLGVEANLPPGHVYFSFLDLQASTLYTNLFVAFGIGFIFCSFVSLLLSQRLAGPIVRLRGYFQKLKDGKSQGDLSFREGDFFPELPGIINDALKSSRGARTDS